ncbi:MAG: glycosyltransferase family 4 protein [Bacteroidota bacterium]
MQAKVLFICLHRPNRSPSQRFRFEQYLDYLRGQGYDCRHVFLLNAKQDKAYYKGSSILGKASILLRSVGKLIRHAFFKKYDLVFVQREAFMLGTPYFERQFAKRSKMIFDFDDTIWREQTGEIKSKNKRFYFLKNPAKTIDLIKAADMVFAGNDYLGDFARQHNGTVKIVPTTIDTVAYPHIPKTESDRVCVGWSGSFTTIIHFEFVIDALKRLKEKYGDKLYFKVIGDGTFQHQELGIQGLPWQMDTEIEDLGEIDIGLMPLPDDEWTKGKCGLKGLQYMALGIPTLMSPVGVNTEIIQDGENGFLAAETDEWVEKISRLVDSFELRQTMGQKGRDTVVSQYSVEANQELYLNSFQELLS